MDRGSRPARRAFRGNVISALERNCCSPQSFDGRSIPAAARATASASAPNVPLTCRRRGAVAPPTGPIMIDETEIHDVDAYVRLQVVENARFWQRLGGRPNF